MQPTSRQRAAACLRAHAGGTTASELRELGSGLDNTTFLAGDLVLRVSQGPDVAREGRLLQLLAARVPIAVPEPVAVDQDHGVLAYRLLPGRPLLGRPAGAGHARDLGWFLRALHSIDLAEVDGLAPVEEADPAEWLADLDGPADLLRILEATVPSGTPTRVLAHADLGAEHVLERDGELTGVIDWSDAAVTDPALDLARLYRDFGPAFLDELLVAYGLDRPDHARIRFFARCAALDDLAYGLQTGLEEYRRAAQRSLGWLFPDR